MRRVEIEAICSNIPTYPAPTQQIFLIGPARMAASTSLSFSDVALAPLVSPSAPACSSGLEDWLRSGVVDMVDTSIEESRSASAAARWEMELEREFMVPALKGGPVAWRVGGAGNGRKERKEGRRERWRDGKRENCLFFLFWFV